MNITFGKVVSVTLLIVSLANIGLTIFRVINRKTDEDNEKKSSWKMEIIPSAMIGVSGLVSAILGLI